MRENFVQPLGMSFQANQEMQGRGSEKEIHHEAILHGDTKSSHAMPNSKDSSCKVNLEHFLESIFYMYISVWSSGSNESNASNDVQFGAETKKLWPIEGNCAKLKMNFALIFPDAKIFALTFPDAKIFALTFPNAKIFAVHFPNAKIFALTFSDAKFFASPFFNAKFFASPFFNAKM